ncbi:cation ABC transporter substrate-binding protein, partial [Acidithiobacillus ferridurans]|nr:cation ABC transporter substrate-binding protein [Acidithiobacillus ferridurans]
MTDLGFRNACVHPLSALLTLIALCAGLGMGQVAAAATIHAVGVENQYANVISQIGGEYVSVTA